MATLQRWTIETTDRRGGDLGSTYVYEGVASVVESEDAMTFYGPAGNALGSIPHTNIINMDHEDES